MTVDCAFVVAVQSTSINPLETRATRPLQCSGCWGRQ